MSDQLNGPVGELLAQVIPRCASWMHRRYPAVLAEDLEQQMWLHALSKPGLMRKHQEAGDEQSIWNEMKWAGKQLGKAEEREIRAKRALAAGFGVDDEFFYSSGLLRMLLPMYVDAGVCDSPPKGRESDSGRSSGDRAEQLGYRAMMIDLDIAMKAIPAHHRNLLRRYFSLPQGVSGDELFVRQQAASSMGMTYDALRGRVRRALVALQQELGGPSPWPRTRA